MSEWIISVASKHKRIVRVIDADSKAAAKAVAHFIFTEEVLYHAEIDVKKYTNDQAKKMGLLV